MSVIWNFNDTILQTRTPHLYANQFAAKPCCATEMDEAKSDRFTKYFALLLDALRSTDKWTPLSRPFFARNKLRSEGSGVEFGAARHRSRPLPFRPSWGRRRVVSFCETSFFPYCPFLIWVRCSLSPGGRSDYLPCPYPRARLASAEARVRRQRPRVKQCSFPYCPSAHRCHPLAM